MKIAFNPNPATIQEICDYYGWTLIQLRSALEKNYIGEIVHEAVEYESKDEED